MFEKRWVQWLIATLGTALVGAGIGGMLIAQGMPRAGWVALALTGACVAIWLIVGLVAGRRTPWIARITPTVAGTAVAAVLFCFFILTNSIVGTITVAAMWAMAILFILGLALIRLLLSGGSPSLGVARAVLDEAIRMKVALAFVVLLLMVIPLLPFMLDPKELLKYRVQVFLSWGLGLTSVLLGLMTVFLSCNTICGDLKHRQVYMSLTKPVRRFDYLVGKWVGIMMLNLLLLTVAGIGIYSLAMVLAQQRAVDQLDALAVRDQILTARRGTGPTPPEGALAQQEAARIEQLRKENPEEYGDEISRAAREAVRTQIIARWHTLPPRGRQTYVFEGLLPAKRLAEQGASSTVQLRLKPKSTAVAADERVRLAMQVEGRPFLLNPIADNTFHVIDLPAQAITEQGTLEITLGNISYADPAQAGAGSVSFTPGEGLEVLYRVGSFGGNLVRALSMQWVRLGFLTMLGLAAGTFLQFPLACVLTLMIYAVAVAAEFQQEALQYYVAFPPAELGLFDKIIWFPKTIISNLAEGKIIETLKLLIRMFGSAFLFVVPYFDKFNPTPLLADGREISMDLIRGALLKIGIASTGATLLAGWLIFRRRELAKVVV